MSMKEALYRYSAIYNRVKKSAATLKEIQDYLSAQGEINGYDLKCSASTFKRDRQDLASLCNIRINYNSSAKAYVLEVDENDELNGRLLEAFETYNALNLSAALANHIDFEHKNRLGLNNFTGILNAIKNRLQLNFDYQTFGQESSRERKTHPYLLKEFKNRWYLVALEIDTEKIKTYGLDRMGEIIVTRKKYTFPATYDPKGIFRDSFGIISSVNGNKPEKVVLSFSKEQGKYVKNLPLHHSQQILKDTDDELIIQLKIYVVYDFIKELLSFGSSVKILEPQRLIDEIKEELKYAYGQYLKPNSNTLSK